jgi:hypothetical protein
MRLRVLTVNCSAQGGGAGVRGPSSREWGQPAPFSPRMGPGTREVGCVGDKGSQGEVLGMTELTGDGLAL